MRKKEPEINTKEKKKKKKTLIIDIFFVLLTLISSAYLIFALTQLGPIEPVIRYIVIGLVSLFDLVLIINLFRNKKKKKRVKNAIKRFLLILLIILYTFIGYNIYRITKTLDNFSGKLVTTSTSLVTLKENEIKKVEDIKNAKIAIGSDKEDSESYKLPKEIIDQYKLAENNEILEYEDYQTMIRDLYAKEVDYIFLPTNYGSIYGQLEEYETLEDDTKIIVSTSKEEEKEEKEEELLGSSKDISEPFTVLLLGVDSKAEGIANANSFNGDAMILVTFNPDTLTATMLSIPRDTYVPISCFSGKVENKITHAASRGTKCVVNTIQDFTGIKIDYYVKINFAGIVDLVDALGGIDVEVPYAFCEQNSKRKWGKNTVYVEAGKQHLNGEQALALARNRKKNTKGMKVCGTKYNQGTRNDFVRGQNQQLVVKGIVNEAKNLENITKVYDLLEAISNNMDTNMSKETLLSFYNVAKDIMTSSKNTNSELVTIQKLYLAGSDQRIYDERSNLVLYNYIPNQDSKAKVIKAMKQNLGLIKTTNETNFSYSIEEPYTQNVIGKSGNAATKTYSLIPDFSTYSRSSALSWGTKNGFTVVFNEVEKTEYPEGKIYAQSYPARKRIDLCSNKTITLTIAKSKQTVITPPKEENNDNNQENNNNNNNNNTENNNNNNENNNSNNQENNSGGSSSGEETTPPPPSDSTNSPTDGITSNE